MTGFGVNIATLIAPLLGIVLTLVLIRLLMPRAQRYGLIDHPAGGRKDHVDATPLVGGIAIVLGHRRLAILELSPAGHQPMHSACGRYVIAFNGEIYNHLELRADLEHAGMRAAWRGNSDTETLLACFVT